MEAEEYLVTFYLVPVMVVGCVSNITTIIVFWVGRFRKNTFRIFAVTMTVCDLISSVVCVPLDIAYLRGGGLLLCRIIFSVGLVPPAISGMTVMLTSWDRYNRICRPLRMQLTARRARIELLFVVILLAAFLFAKLSFLYSSEAASNSIIHCFNHTVQQDIVILSAAIVLWMGTFVIILWTNCRIVMRLRTQQAFHAKRHSFQCSPSSVDLTASSPKSWQETIIRRLSDTVSRQGSFSISASERNLASFKTKTFLALVLSVLAVVLAWLPYLSMRIMILLNPEKWSEFRLAHPRTATEVLTMVSLRSFFISGAINPFIYRFSDDSFRHETLRICGCEKEKESEQTTQQTTKFDQVPLPSSSQREDAPSTFLKRTWSQTARSRELEELAVSTSSDFEITTSTSGVGHLLQRIREALLPRSKISSKTLSSTSVDVFQESHPASGHFRLAAWMGRPGRASVCVDPQPQGRWKVRFTHPRFHNSDEGGARASISSIMQDHLRVLKRSVSSLGYREKDTGNESSKTVSSCSECASPCSRPSIPFDQPSGSPVGNSFVAEDTHRAVPVLLQTLSRVSAGENLSSSV